MVRLSGIFVKPRNNVYLCFNISIIFNFFVWIYKKIKKTILLKNKCQRINSKLSFYTTF